jgi:hypothetical protein
MVRGECLSHECEETLKGRQWRREATQLEAVLRSGVNSSYSWEELLCVAALLLPAALRS